MSKRKILGRSIVLFLGVAIVAAYIALSQRSRVLVEFFPEHWIEKGSGGGAAYSKDVRICMINAYSDCDTEPWCSAPPEGRIYMDIVPLDGSRPMWRTFASSTSFDRSALRISAGDKCISLGAGMPFEFFFERKTNKSYFVGFRQRESEAQ